MAADVAGSRATEVKDSLDSDRLDSVWTCAKANKLGYDFSIAVARERPDLDRPEFVHMREVGDNGVQRLEKTLIWLQAAFDPEEVHYVTFKTMKGTVFGIIDIDLYVAHKDQKRVPSILRNAGAEYSGSRTLPMLTRLHLAKPEYKPRGLVEIDLYEGLPWPTLTAWSEEFFFRDIRTFRIGNSSISIPSPEADLVSIVGGSLFTDGVYTLKDYAYIMRLFQTGFDSLAVMREVKSFGWNNEFQEFLQPFIAANASLQRGSGWPSAMSFPFMVSFSLSIRALLRVARVEVQRSPQGILALMRDIAYRNLFSRVYRTALELYSR